ncbi:MAG TPA: hypothetical protein VGQ74_06750 [Methylomirabilota bacterium]|jgi:hypothetical protein|nr:hypothetical protein [Methylomirabilota bacterium]
MSPAAATYLRAAFQPAWSPGPGDPGRRGFFAPDPRARTLLRVLVSYPEVRFVLPDRVGLEAAADARLIDTLMRFVGRQSWLVTGVTVG